MTGLDRGDSRSTGAESRILDRGALGRFTTHLLLRDSAGQQLVWSPRRNRKGLDPEPPHLLSRSRPRQALLIKPRSVTWWVSVLFMVGAALFAIGSASALFAATFAARANAILFVGSLFFTSAAYLQFLEVVNEPDALTKTRPPVSLWRWEAYKIGWWAALVQLIGTLLFNINTFEATRTLGPVDQDRFVWGPDAVGSICFLVASYLAFVEVSRRWLSWQPRNISWWIVLINLLGSLAFGVSAVASLVTVQSEQMLSTYGSNLWTFIGALCFFAGAYLLLPEMTSHSAAPTRLDPRTE